MNMLAKSYRVRLSTSYSRRAGKSAFARSMAEKAGHEDHIVFMVGDFGRDDREPQGWRGLRVGRSLEGFISALPEGGASQAQFRRHPRCRQHQSRPQDVQDYVAEIRTMPDMASVPVGQGLEI